MLRRLETPRDVSRRDVADRLHKRFVDGLPRTSRNPNDSLAPVNDLDAGLYQSSLTDW